MECFAKVFQRVLRVVSKHKTPYFRTANAFIMAIHYLTATSDLWRMTDEEFIRFCLENKHLRLERDARGNIIFMPPTSFETSDRNSEIGFQLRLWNKKTRAGRVTESNGGYFLNNTAMRAPDAAWISNERLQQLSPEELGTFPHIAPDFVVELRSKSDDLVALQDKMNEYIQNGVRLGWLIDPYQERVFVYRADQAMRLVEGFDQQVSGEEILVGFELDLRELR